MMKKWSMELTKSQLELVQYCVEVMGDMMQEDLTKGIIKGTRATLAKKEIKDCRTVQCMAQLGLVNLGVAEHVQKTTKKARKK
jgi:hypothetical protein